MTTVGEEEGAKEGPIDGMEDGTGVAIPKHEMVTSVTPTTGVIT